MMRRGVRPDRTDGVTDSRGRALQHEGEVCMRVMLIAVALAGLVAGTRTSEARVWYPWCAHYLAGVDIDCSYVSHDQCMRTVIGVSGFCTQNPKPPPGPPPRRYHRAY
jgi:hypothetical protein